jgi:hypothetical protein
LFCSNFAQQKPEWAMTMSTNTLRMLLGISVAIAAATFGATANARFATSSFDPFPFNGTGFAGTATFFLSPGCETNGVHFQNIGGCVFDMEPGLSVTLHEIVNNVDLGTATLNTNSPKFPDTVDMIGLDYQGGDVAALATFVIGGFTATAANPANQSYFDGSWFLQFVVTPILTPPTTTYSNYYHLPPQVTYNTVVDLYHGCVNPTYAPNLFWSGVAIASCNNTDPLTKSVATNVSFTPEPGTLALMLGGVGASWLARRRKQAA